MEKIELGNTGELVSCMALGTMYFGSKNDESTSLRILDLYAGQGGSFLDSANKYASWVPGFQGGESEKLIGKWMKMRRNRQNMFITSKVGFPYGHIPRSLKKEIIISECEKSLKRLGVETIDLYFAHAYDEKTPAEETMAAFHSLKKAGKIRFAGASNFYAWQLAEANEVSGKQGWEGFICIQQRHTYLEPVLRAKFGSQVLLTPEVQEFCASKHLAIMAYSPLLGGAYVSDKRPLPVQYQSVTGGFRMAALKEVAAHLKLSPNAVVLAWMIQDDPRIIPIVTGSSSGQMEENLQALQVRLSKEHMEMLNREINDDIPFGANLLKKDDAE